MADIYLRDDRIPNNDDGTTQRRSIDELFTILTEITPIPPKSIKEQKLGFIVYYENEKDINYIYNPDLAKKLQDKDLLARLTYNTSANRDVYLLNPSSTIYNKQPGPLTAEIEHRNGIVVNELVQFESKSNQKRYIKITLDCQQSRDEVVSKGFILAYHAHLTAKAKIGSNSSSQPSNMGRARRAPDVTAAGAGAAAAAPYHPPSAAATYGAHYPPLPNSYITPSAMHQGRALPSGSSWGGSRSQQPAQPPNPTRAPRNPPGLLAAPPGLSVIQNQHNELEIKAYMLASITFAEKLTEGVEHPESLLNYFNGIIASQGHPPISVPQDILNSSRAIFHNKFQYDPNFHTPFLFHQHHPHNPNQPPSHRRPPHHPSTPIHTTPSHTPASHTPLRPATPAPTSSACTTTLTSTTASQVITTTSVPLHPVSSSDTTPQSSGNPQGISTHHGATATITTTQQSTPASSAPSTTTTSTPRSTSYQVPPNHITTQSHHTHQQQTPIRPISSLSSLIHPPIAPILNHLSPIRPLRQTPHIQSSFSSPASHNANDQNLTHTHPTSLTLTPSHPPNISSTLLRTPTTLLQPQSSFIPPQSPLTSPTTYPTLPHLGHSPQVNSLPPLAPIGINYSSLNNENTVVNQIYSTSAPLKQDYPLRSKGKLPDTS